MVLILNYLILFKPWSLLEFYYMYFIHRHVPSQDGGVKILKRLTCNWSGRNYDSLKRHMCSPVILLNNGAQEVDMAHAGRRERYPLEVSTRICVSEEDFT